MKEGRAALMGLRRAVAGTAGHGHRFLSFTDNMNSLLAFDRSRSCSYDLLCLCRVLRHLETWRNPSDERSRRVLWSGRARLMRSSAKPLAPRHVSGTLGVQVRVNPESANPAKAAPTHFRPARCP